MSFSKTSEVLMKYFLNDFDKFSKKITSTDQNSMDRIFKQFWWDIKIADGLVERYDSQDMIKTKLIKSKNYPELMEGKYIPDSAKAYIRKNMKGYLQAKTNLCAVDVEIILRII